METRRRGRPRPQYRDAYRDPAYKAARAELIQSGATCCYCGSAPAAVADHRPPLSDFPDPRLWVGVLVPSCKRCSDRQGARIANSRGRRPVPSRQW